MQDPPPDRPQLHHVFSAALQAWLRGSGFTPQEAARVLGVDQSIIGQLRAHPVYLSLDTLARMWERVGVCDVRLETHSHVKSGSLRQESGELRSRSVEMIRQDDEVEP